MARRSEAGAKDGGTACVATSRLRNVKNFGMLLEGEG